MATEQGLREVLNKLVSELIKLNILDLKDAQKAIDNVISSIKDNKIDIGKMNLKDALKPNSLLNKTLKIALVGGAINANHPEAKLNVGLMFKDNYNEKDKKNLKDMLTSMNNYREGKKILALENIDELVDKIIENAPQKEKKNEVKPKPKPKHEQHEESHAEKFNKQLLGGATVLGAIATTVQVGIVNSAGIVDIDPDNVNDQLSVTSNLTPEKLSEKHAQPKEAATPEPATPEPATPEPEAPKAEEEPEYKSPNPFSSMHSGPDPFKKD
ncbi:MAG: hypothetical protein P4M12_03685 [Gammaproteobacteria bacterium]|nr:hypothetical protein [Gammaproteobacteria bacterium]